MTNERQKKIDYAYDSVKEHELIKDQNALRTVKNVKSALEQLDNYYDKIVLTQIAFDRSSYLELIENIELNENQKKKYLELKEKNSAIDETLNFEILEDKYSFLNDEMLIMFSRSISIQQRLISLNDERLEIFKKLYEKVMLEVSNPIPIISQILYSMGTEPENVDMVDVVSDELTESLENFNNDLEKNVMQGRKFTEQDLEKLLFIYNFKAFDIDICVDTLEDMDNWGTERSRSLQKIYKLINDCKNGKVTDIKELKNSLLYLAYGIDINYAKVLLKRYKINGIDINNNSDIFKLYYSIYKIVQEQSAEKILKILEEFKEKVPPSFDYKIPYLIEQELKDFYLEQFNLKTYKMGDKAINIDGIDVYEAGTNFGMIVHCIGSYFGKENIENYEKNWNKPFLTRNSLSCSYINNSNLATALVKDVILGFESFEKGSLRGMYYDDLATTEYDRNFSIDMNSGVFFVPDKLIDLTRGLYNELQFERRDISKEKQKYKKQPDYIVFIEEFENEDIENLDENDIEMEADEQRKQLLIKQKSLWEKSKQAAKQFSKINLSGEMKPLPIVKINREECAKSEVNKIVEELEIYEKNKDINKIYDIITRFANNSTGNRIPHTYIREKYFGENFINELIDRILITINTLPFSKDKEEHIKQLSLVLKDEMEKIKYAKNTNFNNGKIKVTNGINSQIVSKIQEIEKDILMEGR